METLAMEQVQPVLHKLCNTVAQKYNLEKEELLQEAQVMALEAIRKYDPTIGTVTGWVYKVVGQRLYRACKFPGFRERFRTHHFSLTDTMDTHIWNMDRFLMEIGQEAAHAVQVMVREMPPTRKIMRKLLAGLGYSGKQIISIFKEIGEAL